MIVHDCTYVCSQLLYCENIDHKVWPSILLKTRIGLPKEWYTTSHFLVVVGAFLALVVVLAVCTGAPTLANELAGMEVCIVSGLCSAPRRARIWGCVQRLASSGRGASLWFYPYLRIWTVVLAPWRTFRHCWLCICSQSSTCLQLSPRPRCSPTILPVQVSVINNDTNTTFIIVPPSKNRYCELFHAGDATKLFGWLITALHKWPINNSTKKRVGPPTFYG